MKIVQKSLFATLLIGAGLSVSALAADDSVREQCRGQVGESYENVADMKFVSKRRFRDGTRIQYAISSMDHATGYDRVQLAVCWLGNESFQQGTELPSAAVVADIDNGFDAKLSDPTVDLLAPGL